MRALGANMERTLTKLNATPGIIGSMLCDRRGEIRARAFPPLFEESKLAESAVELADGTFGTEGLSSLEFRYAEGRLLVKFMPDSFLLALCTKGVNRQLISLSLSVAAEKLSRSQAGEPNSRTELKRPAPARAPDLKADGFLLEARILERSSLNFWDQMHEQAAITRDTASRFSAVFRTGPFRKIVLHNRETGKRVIIPVRIMDADPDGTRAGRVLLSRAAAERLSAVPGICLAVEPATGTGLFGWEGI